MSDASDAEEMRDDVGDKGDQDALEHNLKAASPCPEDIVVAVENDHDHIESKKKNKKKKNKNRKSRAQRQNDGTQQEDNKDKKEESEIDQNKTNGKDHKSQPKSVFTGTKIKLEPSSDGTVDGPP